MNKCVILGLLVGLSLIALGSAPIAHAHESPITLTVGAYTQGVITKGTTNVRHYAFGAFGRVGFLGNLLALRGSIHICPDGRCASPDRLVGIGITLRPTLFETPLLSVYASGGLAYNPITGFRKYSVGLGAIHSPGLLSFSLSGRYDRRIGGDWYYYEINLGIGYTLGKPKLSGGLWYGWNETGRDLGVVMRLSYRLF